MSTDKYKKIKLSVSCSPASVEQVEPTLNEILMKIATEKGMLKQYRDECSISTEQRMPLGAEEIILTILINIMSSLIWEEVVKPAMKEFKKKYYTKIEGDE